MTDGEWERRLAIYNRNMTRAVFGIPLAGTGTLCAVLYFITHMHAPLFLLILCAIAIGGWWLLLRTERYD